MIRSLRLQNFKGIRDVEVGLERLTVFVGPNGSGKTSILQGLDFLINFANSKVIDDEMTGNFLSAYGYYQRNFAEVALELSCTTDLGNVRLMLRPNLSPPLESLERRWKRSIEASDFKNAAGEWRQINELPLVEQDLGQSRLFHFDSALMAAPSNMIGTQLADNGEGLASTLALMALNQPDNFLLVQQGLKAVVPIIERIRFDRSQKISKATAALFESIIFDLKGGVSVSAYAASEGTLLVLGLLTALMNQNHPKLILLDDLDHGLHPLAQRNVVGLLRKVLEQQPNLQIVATTHSPYLVDSLRPEEVRLTTLNDDGTMACGSLVDHPKFDKWKDEMSPGELWSMFGEKWVSQKPQAAETL